MHHDYDPFHQLLTVMLLALEGGCMPNHGNSPSAFRFHFQVRVSGFRLIHAIINETRVSPARRQIGARLVHTLRTIGGGIDKDGMFDSVGTGANSGIVGVTSAYFDLFRHVLHEAEQEHARFPSEDKITTASSTSLLVFLHLLQSLATGLTPSYLLHAFSPNLTSGKLRSSPPHPPPVSLEPPSREGWPGRTGRASSCPSVVCAAGASASRPPLSLDAESISAVNAALPVVEAILGGQGNVLTRGVWGLGSIRQNINIHNAAWKVLGVVSRQLCASAVPLATHTSGGGGSLEPSQQVGELDRHRAAGREWWAAIQATLGIVHQELTRARNFLENLRRNRQAEEKVLAGTGAVRILADPVSLPLPPTWEFPGLQEEDGKEGCALSFWVWIPTRTTIQQLGLGRKERRGSRCSSTRDDMLDRGSRWKVFTQLHEACQQKEASVREPGRYVGVFLRQSLPRGGTKKPESTDDDDDDDIDYGFYVDMVVGTKLTPKSAGRNRYQGDVDDGGDSFVAGPTCEDTTPSGQGEGYEGVGDDKGSDGQQLKMENFLSECAIPPGRWTHICCSYSSTGRGCEKDENDASVGGASRMPCYTAATLIFNGNIVANGAFSPCGIERLADSTTSSLDRALNHSRKDYGQLNRRQTWTPESFEASAPERWEGTLAVCDVHWHSGQVSPEQAGRVADNGIPSQREDVQREAESYVARLVALAENLSTSSRRVVAALSSPRWLSLFLKLAAVAGHHARRAIVHILHSLLCVPSQTIGEDGDSTGSIPKVPLGSPPTLASTGNDFSDRAVVDRICSLLGELLRPLSLCCRRQYPFREAGGTAPGRRLSNCSRQDPSTLSDVVLLLRSLVEEAPNRWREHVIGALVGGVAIAAKGELSSLWKSPARKRGTDADEDNQAWASLGAAAAAVYLGGGLIEGLRLGGRVLLLPNPKYVSAHASNAASEGYDGRTLSEEGRKRPHEMLDIFCMSTDTTVLGEDAVKSSCHGTVVGWRRTESAGLFFVAVDEQYRDCLDETADCNPALQGRCHQTANELGVTVESGSPVVAVRDRQVILQAKRADPTTPFLLQLALPSVLALLDSRSTSTTTVAPSSGDEEATNGAASNQIGAHQLVAAHLRCRLLRTLAVQLRDIGQAGSAVRSKVVRPLLGLAASPLASAIVLALGSDGAAAFGRRSDFAAFILSLRYEKTASRNSLLFELESACQVVWNRLRTGEGGLEGHGLRGRPRSAGNVKERGASDCRPSCLPPTLQVLGGEALVEGSRVTASSHFPTIRLSHVGVGLGSSGRKWYYEVTLLTGGLMQLGWAAPGFQCNPTRGQGVGDHMHSWAFDGFRQKRWSVSSSPYGKRWRRGDVVGISLDAELQEMRFR